MLQGKEKPESTKNQKIVKYTIIGVAVFGIMYCAASHGKELRLEKEAKAAALAAAAEVEAAAVKEAMKKAKEAAMEAKLDHFNTEECQKELACRQERYKYWDKEKNSNAQVYCDLSAENLAKYQMKWTRYLTPEPPHWYLKGAMGQYGTEEYKLVYGSTGAMFQNGFGVWSKENLVCVYNVTNNTAVAAETL
jgi:hypothetical protein